MSKTNNGGPAFPGQQDMCPDGNWNQTWEPGMSRRDWFAGQALTGLLPARDREGRTPVSDNEVEWAAGLAVQYADALIAELEKPR